MYHSRTKKVATYGRRAQRIVAVSNDRQFGSKSYSTSCADRSDSNDASHLSQENTAANDIYNFPLRQLATSTTPRWCDKASNKKDAAEKKALGKDSCIRKPLGSYRTNVPNSPAVSPKHHKPYVGHSEKASLGLRKGSTISPYIDVDIVVLDEDGGRHSEERRVTRANVRLNTVDDTKGNLSRRVRRRTSVKNYALIASAEEGEDDSGDDEYIPTTQSRRKVRRVSKRLTSRSTSHKGKVPPEEVSSSRESSPRDSSDFEPPRRPKTSRTAIRAVVISGSESDSDAGEGSSAGEHRNDGRNVGVPKVRSSKRAATGTSLVSTLDPSGLRYANRNVKESAAANDVAKFIQKTPQRSQMKMFLTSNSRRQKQSTDLKRFSGTPSSIDFGTSQSLHPPTPIESHHLETAFFQQRPCRLSPSRQMSLSDEDESSSIDEELELALQVADIQLAASLSPISNPLSGKPATNGLVNPKARTSRGPPCTLRGGLQKLPTPSFLRPILSECGQLTLFDFTSFIETFPADPIVGFSIHSNSSGNLADSVPFDSFQKVGEASYSEVFGIGNVVLKIVPLLDEENDVSVTWNASWDSPAVSEAQDVLKEIVVTRAMGEACKGFIKLLKTHAVQGSYPNSLLKSWDNYNSVRGSESVRPDHFTSKQAYAVIVLPNRGPDLENFSFSAFYAMGGSGWRQACSIFWQVVRSLGHAEELVHFEHRDLHWGQILVRNTMKSSRFLMSRSLSTRISLDDLSHGVQSTIIDLGLARIDQSRGEPFWTPFSEEIFEGEGDYQYDVYRMMRKHNKDEWQSFRPLTNVMWLHYLADKLIHHKHLRVPERRHRNGRKSGSAELAAMEADKRSYECLLEIERVLSLSIAPIARNIAGRNKRTKNLEGSYPKLEGHAIGKEVKSAADVLRLGKERGWIE